MELDVLETGRNEGWIAQRFQTRTQAEATAQKLSERARSRGTNSTFHVAFLPIFDKQYASEFSGRGGYGIYWQGRGKEQSRVLKRFGR